MDPWVRLIKDDLSAIMPGWCFVVIPMWHGSCLGWSHVQRGMGVLTKKGLLIFLFTLFQTLKSDDVEFTFEGVYNAISVASSDQIGLTRAF
ncbi:hypothetical protein ZIOFF_043072 [Zingiber officinale]|uniref:Uncharacterized protein n=1 Tax=Zingiber officinale TaxID=94328 RepID=A0A8J5KPH8_ZINOF|nr:hypothetical protein ZIOFF_043072 [Zingiber officinale]